MSKLAYLDLHERNGQWHPEIGTLHVAELTEQVRRAATVKRPPRRYRAFAHLKSGSSATLGQLNAMQDSLWQALTALTDGRFRVMGDNPKVLLLSVEAPRGGARLLASPNPADNLDWWLRTAGPEATLVELQDVDPEAVADVQAALARGREPSALAPAPVPIRPITTHVAGLDVAENRAPAEPVHPSVAEVAARRRHELAESWLTADAVCAKLGYSRTNPSQPTKTLRGENRLLGVWVPHERAYRYPPWQFGEDTLIPSLRPILALIREHDRRGEPERRRSGWSEAAWFLAANALLDAQAPKDLLADDPERVLQAARSQFAGGVDAGGF